MTDILIIYKIIVIIYKITVIWLDPELVGSEPYWSDPDPINCPDTTIKSHKTTKKSNKLHKYFFYIFKTLTTQFWIRNKKLWMEHNNRNFTEQILNKIRIRAKGVRIRNTGHRDVPNRGTHKFITSIRSLQSRLWEPTWHPPHHRRNDSQSHYNQNNHSNRNNL